MIFTTKRLFTLSFILFFCQSEMLAQPIANFSANTTSGCVPLLVQYQDQSQGAITSWSWTLGTTTSSLQNPVQLYTTGGIYTICLTVRDTAGLTNTLCKTNYINAYGLPVVDFSANNTVACNPGAVQFTDLSTSGVAITSWQWSFGDGGTSISANPSNTYTQTNNFDVTLAVTDANGCSRSLNKNDFITVVDPPVAAFTAANTDNCSVPHTVNFTNTTVNTGALAFSWDFGDGNVSNAFSPNHIYTIPGVYSVALTVTDVSTGCTDVFTSTNLVDLESKLAFSYSPQANCGPTTVSFSNNSIGTTSNWIWDFGNGDSAFVSNPNYTYATAGCYTVSFTATDQDGCTSTIIDTSCISVYDIPTVSYTTTGNLQGCDLPHTVSFSGISSNATSWLWNFGDGNTDTLQNPTHTYTSFGTFPVSLMVTSPDGCTNSTTLDTIVLEPTIANFSISSTRGCTPLTVTFQDLSTSLFNINSYQWDFGFTTSTLQNPIVVFTDTGYHSVQLIVGNTQGCFDTMTLNNVIGVGTPPNLSFNVASTTSCVGDSILFNNTSDAFTQLWSWDFGDGNTSTSQQPYHNYQDTGLYSVTLTGSHFNCSNTITLTDYILVLPPEAIFSHVVVCDTPMQANFIDASVSATIWEWDFGDNSTNTDTSSLANPSYSYPGRGNYTVTLTVYNGSSGCSHTLTQVVEIRDIEADFSIVEDTVCANTNLNIVNTSLGVASYNWSAPSATLTAGSTGNPNISYSQGLYSNVQLIVTDVNGCQDTAIYTGTISVSDVTPAFTESVTDGCAPLTVNFNENSTTFLGSLTNWSWNFENGATSTLVNPTHTYNNAGTFTPTLTVTNSIGCSRTVSGNAIQPTFPTIGFNSNTIACTGQDITFNNTSVGVGLTYAWDFGDGNVSTLENPVHSYATQDTFTICLTVTDVNGCDTTICKDDNIIIINPTAAFTADETVGRCGSLTVAFQDTSINAVSREWLFGDGTTSTSINPIKTYPSGIYDVCLVVTSASGCVDTLCKSDFITVTQPIADFTFSPDNGCPSLDVTFDVIASGVQTFKWVTGDGGLVIQSGTLGNDTLQLVYPYQSGGTYVPVLIAESDSGCQDITISSNLIEVEVFEVEIDATDTLLCDNGSITFTSLMTSPLPIDTIAWTLSGGSTTFSNDSIITVNFTSVGIYTVTLFSGNGVCSRSITRTIEVVPSPNAGFSFGPTLICHPEEVNFTNSSTISQGSITDYQWNYGTYGSDTAQSPSFLFSVPDTVPVQLIATSGFGCSDTTLNNLIVHPTPVADAGADFLVCRGEIATLSGSGNGTYAWSPSTAVSCVNCPNPTVTIDSSINYVLTVTSAEGCVSTDSVFVTLSQFSAPVITVSNDTTICEGDVIQLFVLGGNSVLDYEWDGDRTGLSCYVGCSNPFASPTTTTTYPVTLTGDGGCQSHDSITVTVIDDSADIVGMDRTICEGDTAQLQTTLGSNPSWTPFEGLSCVFCENPVASPDSTTDYIVNVTTNNGCVIRDTITINVILKNSVSAGDDVTICTNGSIELAGMGAGLINWNNAGSLTDATILNPIASPTSTTEYILSIGTDACILTDTMTVFVVNSATVNDNSFEICEGESVQLLIDGFAQSYSWSPTTGLSDPNIQNPIINTTEEQTYTVTASIPNCPSATATVTVSVNPIPNIEGAPVQQIFSGQNVAIGLVVEENPTFTYQWTPNVDISCVNCPNPTVLGNTDGLQYVITATDLNGCTAMDSIEMNLIEGCGQDLVILPNAFTPDGDGLNDVLYVRGSSLERLETFKVFARNGELLFQSDNLSVGWDGTHNGQAVSTGVYVYYVEAYCELDNRIIAKKGNVTLIRGTN
jgi:gliding motility-associated-like protein